METESLDNLNLNPNNPRTISDTDFANLQQSIKEFGDLSGIIFNIRTQRLVGGHQRREAFAHLGADQINITQRFPEPTSVGTVALGHVFYNGEQYSYRAVDWPESKELAANIAANRITGEWDLEKLGEMDQWLLDNDPDMLTKTGQSQSEIDKLLGNEPPAPAADPTEPQRLSFKLSAAQHTMIDQLIQQVKHDHNIQNPANDDADGNALAFICKTYLDDHAINLQTQ